MLLQYSGTLLKLPSREQLADFPVDRNQSARIVMTAVHQHHTDTQLTKYVFVKQIKPFVPVEADQQAVKMQVVIDGARPVPVVHG